MSERMTRRQRQMLGLDVPPEPADDDPPPLTVPGTLRGAQWRPPRRAVLGIIGCVLVALAVVGFRAWWTSREAGRSAPLGPPAATSVARSTAHPASRSPGPLSAGAPSPTAVLVHVTGRVNRPGLVRVPSGARVQDALTAAGGAAATADLTQVNLARPVADGEQVWVPAHGERAAPPAAATAAGPASAAAAGPAGTPIDINRADAAALDALPGIGPALAGRIVEHREKNGPFTAVDELDQVPGIGPALLSRIRDRCTV